MHKKISLKRKKEDKRVATDLEGKNRKRSLEQKKKFWWKVIDQRMRK